MPEFFPKNIDQLVQDKDFMEIVAQDNSVFGATIGAYYGFPKCCIKNFVNTFAAEVYDKHPNHPMCDTGYVPCESCVEPSKDYAFFSNLINNNRHNEQEFPHDRNQENMDRFCVNVFMKAYPNPLEEISSYPHFSYIVNEMYADAPIMLKVEGHDINISALQIKSKKKLCEEIFQGDGFVEEQFKAILQKHFDVRIYGLELLQEDERTWLEMGIAENDINKLYQMQSICNKVLMGQFHIENPVRKSLGNKMNR